jgi:uncharacterized protein
MIDLDAADFARQACRGERNVLGAAFFEEHLSVVAGISERLAEALGADLEVVRVAAYLHDISAVSDITTLPDHARLSAELARAWVTARGGTAVLAEAVSRCVAAHSQPLIKGTAEEICLSNADALAQIARPAYWLWFAFSVRKLGFAEGRAWLRGLNEKNWRALAPVARTLGQTEYDRAMSLLANAGEE